MALDWENYDCHPEIGPLMDEYRQALRELEFVKQGLRTQDNIQTVMQMSYEAAEIKRQIQGLMEIEEERVAARNRETLWLGVSFAAVAVGVAHLLVGLGLL